MGKIVSVHSFRGGTGKSNLTANLAAALAGQGATVGVIDTDIQSPGIHVIFNMAESAMTRSLNDYLWGRCTIRDTAYDVTHALGPGARGRLFLIPSSLKAGEIARVLRDTYDVGRLNDGFRDLLSALNLDFLLIDTHPGVNEETLLGIAMSDTLVLILRADAQDWQGTAVTVELARRLEVPRMLMVVNKLPASYDVAGVRQRVEQTYQATVAGILPLCSELVELGSSDLFIIRHRNHPVAESIRQIARQLNA